MTLQKDTWTYAVPKMDRDRGDAAKGDRDRLKYEMPLFAHSFPPLANEQASGKPVGHHPDHGQKQDIRFGGDNPNTPDC